MDFKNLIIYSDVDGTLLRSWGEGVKPSVDQENIKAIKYFIDNGGHFSIASGREYKSVMSFFDYDLNMPIVQSNGAAVFDYSNKEVVYHNYLSVECKKELINLCFKNKKYYLCCGTLEGIYQVDFNDYRDTSLNDIDRKHVSIDYCLENDLCKLCYVVNEKYMGDIKKDIEKLKCRKSINALQSSPIYYECFDINAGKANGIKRAIEYSKLTDKTLICIGDYYNDVDMLRIADIKVCPNNSPDDIKKMCDFVVNDNNHCALKDLIYTIYKKKE